MLLSGGIDSTACVDFYLSQGMAVEGRHFSYGQASAKQEEQAAEAVARHYGIRLIRTSCVGVRSKGHGLILGRNAFLLFAALLESQRSPLLLAIGIHSGTDYYDCSPGFVSSVQQVFDGYTEGTVRVAAPFLAWSKQDIWHFCAQRGVPVHLTYSCERGAEQPCGVCRSCRDLESLRACQDIVHPA